MPGLYPTAYRATFLRFYAVGSSLFLLSVCFCLCSLFYRDDVLCWLLLARPFLYAFHAHLRFPVDLVWFRLSCDHGWIRSGSVNVRKQQQQQQQHKQLKTSQTGRQGRGRHLEGLAAKNKNKTRAGPHTGLAYIAGRKQLKATAKKQTKQNRTRNYCANLLASRWRCTLDWRRSARHQALSRASARFSIPRCHMPTFFAAVVQLSPSLTTTPLTHFRPSPLRGIALKASRFFWGSSPKTPLVDLLVWALHHQPPKHDSLYEL